MNLSIQLEFFTSPAYLTPPTQAHLDLLTVRSAFDPAAHPALLKQSIGKPLALTSAVAC